jgi:molybdenum cofactor cytidylyltransferase
MTAPIGALILAAGGSLRLGEPKQFLVYRGKSLLRRAADAAEGAGCLPIVVVAGRDRARVSEEIGGSRIQVVENPDWQRGVGVSIRVGMKALLEEAPSLGAVVIMVCDQPFAGPEEIAALALRYGEQPGRIVASRYKGTLGVPAVFDRFYFPELQNLSDEQGAKPLFALHREALIPVPFPEGGIDIDTPEDYQILIASDSRPLS